ncbi:hydroxymethylglutaryl-CoA synthase [Leuconostoc palmae]|uniref:hydroxymethylglutaryl-CoA synthase n=1 Tax=Leuconostoc palmae TaxID=501487 RepID=UPI001C7CAA36|nr:hydroxymethylglutaryl-CoA synthase [Leuconostoc palmae]
MLVGIDKIAFYTPRFYLDLVDLAKARGDEPEKYTIGIGQDKQAVIPNYEDIVTMGTNAAKKIVDQENIEEIDTVIFATESGIDNSKSAAIYVQRLLGLSPYTRTIELKQACYAGTYGIMQAKDYVLSHPDKKVLVIAADIARYGLNTPGEVTQGGGAIAMIISSNPKILSINDDSVFMSQDIADFWRPLDRSEALVDGHLSTDVYKKMFVTLWQQYKLNTNKTLNNLSGFAFHLPYTKMGKKALDQILVEATDINQKKLLNRLYTSQLYSRQVGNIYTGSVYLSLLSLINNQSDLKSKDELAIFSYGSGAEAELFSVTLQEGFENYLPINDVREILDSRQQLSVTDYELMFKSHLYCSNIDKQSYADNTSQLVQFFGWEKGQRIYR